MLMLLAVTTAGSACTVDLEMHPCADDADCPEGGYCDGAGTCVIRVDGPTGSPNTSVDLGNSDSSDEAAYGLTAAPAADMTILEGSGSVPGEDETVSPNQTATDGTQETVDPPSGATDNEPQIEPDWGDTLDGEHCEVAVPLSMGRNEIDTRPYSDDYSELDGACPGISSRGSDMVGAVTVPPRTRLELSLEATDFDAVVSVSRTCSFTELACIAGSFPGQSAPDFVNLTDDDVEVFVVIDGRQGAAGTGVLVIAFSDIGNPNGDSLYSAIEVHLGFYEAVAYHGDTSAYSNDYTDYSAIDGHLSCCQDCSAEGSDTVFRIAAPDVEFDYFIRAGVDGELDSVLALATSSSASPSTCGFTDGDWVQHYQRQSDPDVSSYWVIVDGAHAGSEGLFDIGFSVY